MKILFGIDDSPHSRAALEKVRTIHWPEGTEVVVLSVARPVAVMAYADLYAPSAASIEPQWREEVRAHEDLAARAGETLRAAGLRAEGRVLQGDPREALVDEARRIHADLVVLGSHGRTGLARLVLGSVASYVVGHAPCDVLVVKLPGHAPA